MHCNILVLALFLLKKDNVVAFWGSGLKDFDIPENEVPIMVIGFGYVEDQFNVAISERKNVDVTNTVHN